MSLEDGSASGTPTEVRIELEDVSLIGDLGIPNELAGVVVFAHGSGSSRLSTRNQDVAMKLRESGFATLLFDLLTPSEAGDRRNVFDVELLADRLVAATARLEEPFGDDDVPIGYFGASTGAAAALWAAAHPRNHIAAVVSRGGRPDLAGEKLGAVSAPTLLIVGGDDTAVLEINRAAVHHLGGVSELEVVPGATHLFEEPGALDEVSTLASDWFGRHFTAWQSGAPG